MNIRLSKTKIESYVGDVLPLRLISEENIENAAIKWTVSGKGVSIRRFDGDEEHPFSDGVLLRFDSVGESTVTAKLAGEEFVCEVLSREMRKASSDDDLNYYRGDIHTHTSLIHNHEQFVNRTSGFQSEMVEVIKKEGLLDFGVITDHADVINLYEYFRAYTAAEDAEPMRTVMFPGCESDNLIMKTDMAGRQYRAAGEVVIINADNNITAHGWDDLLDGVNAAPRPIGVFAHPQIGAWSFEFELHGENPDIVKLMRCVEMGQGNDRGCNLLHEYAFSLALDAGFRVASCSGSDVHSEWGFKAWPGKTIVMAHERSKEAITDALINNRVYASDTGNVKVKLLANGKCAPCDLDISNKYSFDLSLSYFEEDDSTKIVKCQLISDYGNKIYEVKDIKSDKIHFEIVSDSARYFYLRLIDREGRRTFSPPVWCGREFDKYVEPNLERIDSSQFTAFDEISGKDARNIIDFDVSQPWENGEKRASIIVDMKKEEEISALAYVHPTIPSKNKEDLTERSRFYAKFPRRYRVSTSLDGVKYVTRAEGGLRRYRQQEIIRFDECRARFLKFEVLSTFGEECELKQYENATLHFGGMLFFKNE